MQATVHQFYYQNVVTLPEAEQLKLASLILENITKKKDLPAKQNGRTKSITNSGEILDEDFDSVKRENARLFNEALEKRAAEIIG